MLTILNGAVDEILQAVEKLGSKSTLLVVGNQREYYTTPISTEYFSFKLKDLALIGKNDERIKIFSLDSMKDFDYISGMRFDCIALTPSGLSKFEQQEKEDIYKRLLVFLREGRK